MRTTIDQRILTILRRGPAVRWQLAELLGVSSGGLRKAIVRLSAAGAIELVDGRWQLTAEARSSAVA